MSRSDRMERFAKSRHGGTDAVIYINDGSQPPYLKIADPRKLAALVAFLKLHEGRSREGKVFVRGQCDRHGSMRPSLFRNRPDEMVPALAQAYRTLIRRLPEVLRGSRFRQPNLGAALQHYGFKTPWLDVVDNLFVGTWFALNRCTPDVKGRPVFVPSRAAGGWLFFVTTGPVNGSALTHVDLRESHSSLNVRCHAQHGVSVAFGGDDEALDDSLVDFSDQVLASVWIPNDREWSLTGKMSSYEFFFPERSVDDTYRRLLNGSVTQLVATVEHECDVPEGSLGRTTEFGSV